MFDGCSTSREMNRIAYSQILHIVEFYSKFTGVAYFKHLEV